MSLETTATLFSRRDLDEVDEAERKWAHQYTLLTEGILSKPSEDERRRAIVSQMEEETRHCDISIGLIFGILTDPVHAEECFDHLCAGTRDSFSFAVKRLEELALGKFHKMLDVTRKQFLWLAGVMADRDIPESYLIFIALMRYTTGTSPTSQWNAESILKLLTEQYDYVRANTLLASASFLMFSRAMLDLQHPQFASLRQREAEYCVRLARDDFRNHILPIGREIVRIFYELSSVPGLDQLWKDVMFHPERLVGEKTDLLIDLLKIRTPTGLLRLMVGPETERDLMFMMRQVKMSRVRRYQLWFMDKHLAHAEQTAQFGDCIRFICGYFHPPNQILASDIVQRWALIGWLLKCRKSTFAGADCHFSLFLDWYLFDPFRDSIMDIEPAILLLIHSLPRYAEVTRGLLSFLMDLPGKFAQGTRKDAILRGMTTAFKYLVRKGVVSSLQPLWKDPILEEPLRIRFCETFPSLAEGNTDKKSGPLTPPSSSRSGAASPTSISLKQVTTPPRHGSGQLYTKESGRSPEARESDIIAQRSSPTSPKSDSTAMRGISSSASPKRMIATPSPPMLSPSPHSPQPSSLSLNDSPTSRAASPVDSTGSIEDSGDRATGKTKPEECETAPSRNLVEHALGKSDVSDTEKNFSDRDDLTLQSDVTSEEESDASLTLSDSRFGRRSSLDAAFSGSESENSDFLRAEGLVGVQGEWTGSKGKALKIPAPTSAVLTEKLKPYQDVLEELRLCVMSPEQPPKQDPCRSLHAVLAAVTDGQNSIEPRFVSAVENDLSILDDLSLFLANLLSVSFVAAARAQGGLGIPLTRQHLDFISADKRARVGLMIVHSLFATCARVCAMQDGLPGLSNPPVDLVQRIVNHQPFVSALLLQWAIGQADTSALGPTDIALSGGWGESEKSTSTDRSDMNNGSVDSARRETAARGALRAYVCRLSTTGSSSGAKIVQDLRTLLDLNFDAYLNTAVGSCYHFAHMETFAESFKETLVSPVKHNFALLRLLCETLDPSHFSTLVLRLGAGQISLFGENEAGMITDTLDFDTYEQTVAWGLLCAEASSRPPRVKSPQISNVLATKRGPLLGQQTMSLSVDMDSAKERAGDTLPRTAPQSPHGDPRGMQAYAESFAEASSHAPLVHRVSAAGALPDTFSSLTALVVVAVGENVAPAKHSEAITGLLAYLRANKTQVSVLRALLGLPPSFSRVVATALTNYASAANPVAAFCAKLYKALFKISDSQEPILAQRAVKHISEWMHTPTCSAAVSECLNEADFQEAVNSLSVSGLVQDPCILPLPLPIHPAASTSPRRLPRPSPRDDIPPFHLDGRSKSLAERKPSRGRHSRTGAPGSNAAKQSQKNRSVQNSTRNNVSINGVSEESNDGDLSGDEDDGDASSNGPLSGDKTAGLRAVGRTSKRRKRTVQRSDSSSEEGSEGSNDDENPDPSSMTSGSRRVLRRNSSRKPKSSGVHPHASADGSDDEEVEFDVDSHRVNMPTHETALSGAPSSVRSRRSGRRLRSSQYTAPCAGSEGNTVISEISSTYSPETDPLRKRAHEELEDAQNSVAGIGNAASAPKRSRLG
eukprot:Rmarinus@m.27157